MTAPKSHVKVSGAWKGINKMHVKVSGAWKEVSRAYVKVSGAWKQIHQYYRLFYDYSGAGSNIASRGTNHTDLENLAYIGVIGSSDSASHTYTGFTWDGVAGDHAVGTQDNSNEEHNGVAVGMINVGVFAGDYDYDKTFAATGLQNDNKSWFRIVGGRGQLSYVTHQASSHGAYPQTQTFDLLKDDIVVLAVYSRATAASNFEATNMTKVFDAASTYCHKVFIQQIASDGSWSTTMTNTNKSQQWCHLLVIYRPVKT